MLIKMETQAAGGGGSLDVINQGQYALTAGGTYDTGKPIPDGNCVMYCYETVNNGSYFALLVLGDNKTELLSKGIFFSFDLTGNTIKITNTFGSTYNNRTVNWYVFGIS